jgi:hypothetical protein
MYLKSLKKNFFNPFFNSILDLTFFFFMRTPHHSAKIHYVHYKLGNYLIAQLSPSHIIFQIKLSFYILKYVRKSLYKFASLIEGHVSFSRFFHNFLLFSHH